jgi:hypothetical protein
MWAQGHGRVSVRKLSQAVISRRWRWLTALAALALGLLLLDALLYQITLPVAITSDGAHLTFAVGGATRRLDIGGRIVAVSVPARDPVLHEFQLDGTDDTNNFTLDPAYFHSIAPTAFYQFYAWMRDLDGLSRWRDLCAGGASGGAQCIAWPALSGTMLLTPESAGSQRITAQLQRPETPVALALTMSDGSDVTLTLNRNDRTATVTRAVADQSEEVVAQWFFPTDAAPFAAMTLDFVARVTLWALALLGVICGGELLLGYLLGAFGVGAFGAATSSVEAGETELARRARGLGGWLAARWRTLSAAIHPIGLVALAASFAFVVWIALAQYHAQPHIYDASAYLFGAKTFAAGRLWAPAPPPAVAADFPGPFMVIYEGKWFTQYEPGTSLTLALGVALGVPWLVEPLLGTLALLGVGLIARRLYDRRVATLAVLLGAASPFYSYLAASYLSHTITLFYLVWGFWALLRWLQDARQGAGWYLPLAALLWVMGAFTRETSIIFATVVAAGALWLAWRGGWPALRARDWRQTWRPRLALLGVALLGLAASFGYHAALTGDPFITPRELFFPGDHYGFGPGVGFYGAHTLAAGFVNLDELLTSLAIGLYGWPFYLTLAFLLIPFLARRAVAADVVMLLGAAALTFAFIGYFYPGIYLGPRYLFEALPFYLILTARGLLTLAEAGRAARLRGAALAAARAPRQADARPAAGPRWAGALSLTSALTLALVACWALYYLPRQVTLHSDFTGMGAKVAIKTSMLEHPPLRNALVITDDKQLYGYTLFGLNDPLLRGNVIYAEAFTVDDYARLRRAFPTRTLYALFVAPDGTVQFIREPSG